MNIKRMIRRYRILNDFFIIIAWTAIVIIVSSFALSINGIGMRDETHEKLVEISDYVGMMALLVFGIYSIVNYICNDRSSDNKLESGKEIIIIEDEEIKKEEISPEEKKKRRIKIFNKVALALFNILLGFTAYSLNIPLVLATILFFISLSFSILNILD